MKKVVYLLALPILCGALSAQTQPTTATDSRNPQVTQVAQPTQERGTNYSWIGLLGLAGLTGLMRRRDKNINDVSHRTDQPGNLRKVG